MKIQRLAVCTAVCALFAGSGSAQAATTIDALQASAKVYAGLDWPGTYTRLCIPAIASNDQVIPTINPALYPSGDAPDKPNGDPPIGNWYAPPAQIGDNLYFLGTRAHSTYALVSKKGEIILMDGNYEYATTDEILKGLGFLGLDPDKVKYAIFSHAHSDHDGGAYLEQAAFRNATVIYGTGDWPSVLQRTVPHATRSGLQNDGTDGRVVKAGDVSVQIITMPGHTPGTLSFLFEFKDGKEDIRVAYVGGTAISFTEGAAYYDTYLNSSQKFARAAAAFGATAILSNHTEFDLGYFKANTAARLRNIDKENVNVPKKLLKDVPNPYNVGAREVMNYFGVVELCTKAAKLRATGSF
jgi:metallo-beta-lactamase class B